MYCGGAGTNVTSSLWAHNSNFVKSWSALMLTLVSKSRFAHAITIKRQWHVQNYSMPERLSHTYYEQIQLCAFDYEFMKCLCNRCLGKHADRFGQIFVQYGHICANNKFIFIIFLRMYLAQITSLWSLSPNVFNASFLHNFRMSRGLAFDKNDYSVIIFADFS